MGAYVVFFCLDMWSVFIHQGKVLLLQDRRLEATCLSTEEITEYFLPSWYYTAVDRETIFTWAVQGVPEMDHLHIITLLEIEEFVPADTCTFPSGAAT